MSRWYRMYADAHRNPKVARLSDRDYRTWTTLLAVAAENDGLIPCLEDLKHLISMRLDHLSSALDRLIRGGLIDPLEAGYEPHNWNKFQYKSDTSAPRVTLHRERKRAVTVTPPETEADTDTESTIPNGIVARAKPRAASADKPGDVGDQVWADFQRLRRTQRAPVTETALAGIRREAGKAGVTMERALTECCERSWRSFKADWHEREKRNGRSNGQSASGYGSTIDAALAWVEEG